jgi:hypothetical protein
LRVCVSFWRCRDTTQKSRETQNPDGERGGKKIPYAGGRSSQPSLVKMSHDLTDFEIVGRGLVMILRAHAVHTCSAGAWHRGTLDLTMRNGAGVMVA